MRIKQAAIGAAVAIGFGASAGNAIADDRWKVMEPIGDYQIVVVNEDHWLEKGVYSEIIPHVCVRQSNHCKVLFWKDEDLVPTSFPMRHRNSSGIVAYNVFEARGVDLFSDEGWSCEIVDQPDICFDVY